MSILGLSFGASKTKTNETTDMSSLDQTNQTTTGTQSQGTKGTQNTSQSSAGTSSGSSATTGNQQTNQKSTTGTSSATSSFDQATLNQLTSTVQGLLGGATKGGGMGADALAAMAKFDPASYVKNIVDSARSDSQDAVDTANNVAGMQTGGTAGTNSMSALIAGKLANQQATTLAGVQAGATKDAQAILGQNVTAANQSQSLSNDLLTQLTGILKGGRTTAAQTGSESTQGTSNTASGTQTAEQQAQQANTNTTSSQDILTQILQTLQGTEQKTGTSTTVGSTSKIGGGASLSL